MVGGHRRHPAPSELLDEQTWFSERGLWMDRAADDAVIIPTPTLVDVPIIPGRDDREPGVLVPGLEGGLDSLALVTDDEGEADGTDAATGRRIKSGRPGVRS